MGIGGEIECSVPLKESEKFGLFLQELMLNQSIYYYLCGVPNRRKITYSVVRPIFQELLEATFRSRIRGCFEGNCSAALSAGPWRATLVMGWGTNTRC